MPRIQRRRKASGSPFCEKPIGKQIDFKGKLRNAKTIGFFRAEVEYGGVAGFVHSYS